MYCRDCGRSLSDAGARCQQCLTRPPVTDAADSLKQTDSQPASQSPAVEDSSMTHAGQADGSTPFLPISGVLSGLGAFLIGYLLTGVALYLDISRMGEGTNPSDFVSQVINEVTRVGGDQIIDAAGGELLLSLRAIGWTFFSAQQIPLDGTASGLGRSVSETVDILTVVGKIAEVSLTTPVYYLIPVVSLLASGLFVARRADTQSRFAGAVAGSQVVFGYLPCIGLASVLMGLTVDFNFLVVSGTVTTEPALSQAILMGGFYALVVGGAGGLLGTWLKIRRE